MPRSAGANVDYNDMVLAIAQLATAIEVRNDIDCKRVKIDERREIREWRFKCVMLSAIMVLAGVEVTRLAGLM